jgi:hypothetical protein
MQKTAPSWTPSTLAILAIQEEEIRRIVVQSQPREIDPILKKTHYKKGLVEWLKV